MGKFRFSSVIPHRTVPTGVQVEPTYIRRHKVKNPEISADDLAEYAFDLDLATRLFVARHPNVSVDTLEKLAMDDSAKVRIAVAQNPKSTARILEKLLANFGDVKYICRNVAVHPNASAGILAMLSHCEDVIVLFNVAKHPNTMNETLVRLLECESESVRNVARQRSQDMTKQFSTVKLKFIPTNGSKCF